MRPAPIRSRSAASSTGAVSATPSSTPTSPACSTASNRYAASPRNSGVSIGCYDKPMLVAPIEAAGPVPAEQLFPSWRGREPYGERLKRVSGTLYAAHPGLAGAITALPFLWFESAWEPDGPVQKYNDVPAAAAASIASLAEELRTPWLCALMLW